MILTGSAIHAKICAGEISISPYDQNCLNPASLDLHLGEKILHYTGDILDSRMSNNYEMTKLVHGERFLLFPNKLYLMHTAERISSSHYVTIIDGKSSLGRLGISIHQTAGYGDPGFDGQYTLEVSCIVPVYIYCGMRFCQARFHSVEGYISNYQEKGHYVANGGVNGPQASMAFRQFMEEEKCQS